jgi:PPP family 3-phenylpropionic acid transporter
MALRLSLFYAAIFLAAGISLPFWPVWLQGRGLSAAEIGLVLSIGMWLRAFTSPVLAQLADRSGRPDRMVVALAWIAFIAFFAYWRAYGFWPILAISIVTSAALSAIFPLGDAVTMLKVREGTVDYGRVRMWGSIAFILAAVTGGRIIAGRPSELILWLLVGCMALQLGAVYGLPRTTTAGTARLHAPLLAILRDRPFLGFVAIASSLQASHAVFYGFSTLHWRGAGYDATLIGALWAEGVIAEVVLFAISKKLLTRLPPLSLLALAAAAGVVRWTVLGATTALPALIAAQLLHAFTFGATHLSAMHQIARTVPPAHGATAQSFYSSFAGGLTMAAAMAGSGWLYARFGGSAFFAMAGISLAAGLAIPALARATGWRSGRSA